MGENAERRGWLEGRSRVVVEAVSPAVDRGRYPAKRIAGEDVDVEVTMFCDGHDQVRGVCRYRYQSWEDWREASLEPVARDRHGGRFCVDRPGLWHFVIDAWVDAFGTWRTDLQKRRQAGQDLDMPLRVGASIVRETASRATGEDAERLERDARALEEGPMEDRIARALDEAVLARMHRHDPRLHPSRSAVFTILVDREKARCSAWYELFPRSWGPSGQHGTFRDVAERLDYVAQMGFDVLYLPPIHPIGRTRRKGPDNALEAGPDDVGSPWAIGSAEGGHKAIHPSLGTFEDFQDLLARAEALGIEIALDMAFQCSPDHPYLTEHPEWFRKRPDGSIQYAENPPKRYEDIYAFDFECEDWRSLWQELRSIFTFWIEQGVRIFRVDNPHTKSLQFWEWCIQSLRRAHPDIILLSEAFTRPRVLQHLAKIGFSQSYTYFAWKNTREELEAYLTELTRTEVADYLRPNLWPNTPDILNAYLQVGGRPAFMARGILAATLSSSYGVYGPAFELIEQTPRHAGSEEYLHSEKYQLRDWDLKVPHSLAPLLERLNALRHHYPALQHNDTLQFHRTDNPLLICYSKAPLPGEPHGTLLMVVNLDPHNAQSGWTELDLDALGVSHDRQFQVHDLLTDTRYLWHGARNYVMLSPLDIPAHVFRIRHWSRSERDFEYFM